MNHVGITACPLCEAESPFAALEGPDGKSYFLCGNCHLIFAERCWLPTEEEEIKHYKNHENGIAHTGYVDFLNKAIQPALPCFKPGMLGLDYGCGAAPTLSLLLHKSGYAVDNYDPYFFPQLPQHKTYHFIFATECLEHFFHPGHEMKRLNKLLLPNGYLVIMTEQWKTLEDFGSWYYVRDPTHVAFYHLQTFLKISSLLPFKLLYTDEQRVVILQKQA